MIKKIVLVFCLLTLLANTTFAQVDYKQLYFNGKSFFREGKYNLAMEVFKKVIPYDQSNPFSEYASFYYALSAYNQGYKSVAKDSFNQLKTLYPKWDKMDEVNFWLAKIYFDNKDYFQGLKLLSTIQDRKLQPPILALKKKTIEPIEDRETLRMMNEEYPKDEIIANVLAKAISKDLSNAEDRVLLESLIGRFNFKRTDFIPETPKTFYKDIYSVSVLFPFMVNSLEPSTGKKRNQIILDLYEGMKLAADTLKKMGINISLRAYDTERSADKTKKILETEELKNTDLIVGAIYPEENKPVQEFSQKNGINVFNPVSNNSDNIGTNPYAFLFQPSFETIGKKAGEFLYTHAKKKNCIVFYGNTRRDSVLASNFIQKAGEKGLKVVSALPVTKERSEEITSLLATPTEYDEFKYPKQFTLKKDSIGSIYVASDEALIYTKVLSGVETRGDSILVLGSENWLNSGTYEKYQRLGIVMASPTFTPASTYNHKVFAKKFIRIHGRTPSTYVKLGYDFMLFAGQQLKKNGVYFQEGMSKETFIRGNLSEGYNFQLGRDNQIVPFVKFVGGELKVIGKR